ncbi:MAG: hypothetical protein ABJF10_02280 [Chthoniobacter sp.]|uniref:BC1872 family protein n=1 Tax=Chthoniobacter sp. TaxID=2510640 RepID=UPI0032A8857D
MRKDDAHLKLRVASLKELDALVGKYLTKETPQVFWEEEHACLRFESIEEALEAMRDPYFQLFIPEDARANTALKEVQEFRAYSSELALAWEVVERISPQVEPMHVRCESGLWYASFGEREESCSKSAPVAICLAALRAHGMDVDFSSERKSTPGDDRAVA